MVTEYPRACSNFASEADMIPLPKDDVTPPVTNIYLDEATALICLELIENAGKSKV